MTDQPTTRPPLRRRTDDRMVAGVCSGVARSLGIDPIIVRIVLVAFALLGGSGFAIYLIGWLLIPADDSGTSLVNDPKRSNAGRIFFIVVLVWAGLEILRSPGNVDLGQVLVLAAIALGGYLWWTNRGTTPAPLDSTEPGSKPSPLGALTLSVLALVIGFLLFLQMLGVAEFNGQVYLATGLIVLGTGLLVGAFVGDARWLVALAVPLLLIATINANVGNAIGGGIGDRAWTPTSVSAVEPEYSLAMGTGVLDLSELAIPAGDVQTISARVGVGTLRVILPAGVGYEITARTSVGSIEAPDAEKIEGTNMYRELERTPVAGAGTIVLDLQVSVGTLEVRDAQTSV